MANPFEEFLRVVLFLHVAVLTVASGSGARDSSPVSLRYHARRNLCYFGFTGAPALHFPSDFAFTSRRASDNKHALALVAIRETVEK